MSAETYRGWIIRRGRWPEPEWMAFSPDYDASWEGEEDGWVDNGQKADAPTREALIAEIDAWFEENEPASALSAQSGETRAAGLDPKDDIATRSEAQGDAQPGVQP